LDIADKVIIVSGGTIKTIGSKDEVLPHLSEIYSTCTVLEEVE
jgi:ABC-type protease/lipase transport system fused ATPase/permease subunit